MPEVGALGEIGVEQSIDHRLGLGEARGEAHQAMGVEARGHAEDAVEAELHPFRLAEFGDGGVQAARACWFDWLSSSTDSQPVMTVPSRTNSTAPSGK